MGSACFARGACLAFGVAFGVGDLVVFGLGLATVLAADRGPVGKPFVLAIPKMKLTVHNYALCETKHPNNSRAISHADHAMSSRSYGTRWAATTMLMTAMHLQLYTLHIDSGFYCILFYSLLLLLSL